MLHDPTVLFTICVVLVPLVYCPDLPSAIKYLTEPAILLSLALTFVIVKFAHSVPCLPLTPHERRIAFWFLMNGVYFNLFLDVIAGQFQSMGEMSRQYNFVEPRYALGPFSDAGSPVFITSMLELFCHSPIGIFAYIAYTRRWPQRHIAAFTVSLLHAIGVVYFYIPEVINGFRHLGGWPQSIDEALTFHRLLFFWFGFWFCGVVWILVPSIIARYAWNEMSAAMSVVDNDDDGKNIAAVTRSAKKVTKTTKKSS